MTYYVRECGVMAGLGAKKMCYLRSTPYFSAPEP